MSANIKIKVLTNPEKRNSKYGGKSIAFNAIAFNAIDPDSTDIKEVFVPETTGSTIKKGKFYLLTNVSVDSYIRALKNTKILQCTKFPYDKKIEKEFYDPPEVSVAETLRSANKRRLSVIGTLTDKSDIEGSGAKRWKTLTLSNEGTSIKIKLWDDQVNCPHPTVGTDVVVTCGTVNHYHGQVEVNSTPLTKIKERHVAESAFSGTVEAADFESETPSIKLKDDEALLVLTKEQLSAVFPLEEIEENVEVEGRKNGLRVVSIKRSYDWENPSI